MTYCSQSNPTFDFYFTVGKIPENFRRANSPNSLRHSSLFAFVTTGLYAHALVMVG